MLHTAKNHKAQATFKNSYKENLVWQQLLEE